MRRFRLLIKEIAAFYWFFWKNPKPEKTVVFYAEHEGYYPYFEGIVEKLTGEHNPALCYVTSDPDDPILQRAEARIKSFYVNKLLPYLMAFVDCKVFVMTLTDLNQFRLKRSKNPVHYVYVFHALISTHRAYRYGAFDHYDSILCTGPHHTEEIRRHEELSQAPRKMLVEAGYYRLERIYAAYQKYSSDKPPSRGKGTVLIAPSWGAENVLESLGERLIDILLEAGYEVIVRPHPETVRRSPDLMAALTEKYADNPNVTLEMSVATDDSLLRADVLICDLSGVALEYAFGTERPVLFLDVPLKINNKRFLELDIEPIELALRPKIGVILSPEKLDTVPRVIANLMQNNLTYKNRIAELREQNVYAFGHSSDIGSRHINDLIMDKSR